MKINRKFNIYSIYDHTYCKAIYLNRKPSKKDLEEIYRKRNGHNFGEDPDENYKITDLYEVIKIRVFE